MTLANLVVDLTSGNDVVVVNQISGADNGGIVVDLTVNGNTTRYGDSVDGVLGIEINGLAGDDSFTLMQTLAAPLTIDGGLDNDTIIGPDELVSWTIDGPNSGSGTGDLLFSGVENIIGGTENDEFNVSDTGTLQRSDRRRRRRRRSLRSLHLEHLGRRRGRRRHAERCHELRLDRKPRRRQCRRPFPNRCRRLAERRRGRRVRRSRCADRCWVGNGRAILVRT
jgi:hypothetical protein